MFMNSSTSLSKTLPERRPDMFFLKETRRKPVKSLKEFSLKGVGFLIEQEAVKQSRYGFRSYLFVLNFSARILCSQFGHDGYSKDIGDKLFSR